MQNMQSEFVCEICDYKCSRKFCLKQHQQTAKHINATNAISKYACNNCEKYFNHHSSLHRHQKTCNPVPNIEGGVVIELLKQNQDFKMLIIEQNNKLEQHNTKMLGLLESNNSITNNTTNNSITQVNSNNKTFNLQVFLNEDCKDAMNVSDFMNSLNLQVSDLECVGQLGFVEGISNIIIKRLNAMDITKRPVHCTDSKRETIYIKEDGVWTKDDDDNMKIRKLVRGVSFRNCRNAGAYKAMYPECRDPESKHSYIYDKIVLEAFGGSNKGKDDENENKIIRKILKHLTIDKSAFI